MLDLQVLILILNLYRVFYLNHPISIERERGANLVCLWLLTRHRRDNLNMSSVWLCSRNEIIANTSVLVAAGLTVLTHSALPDLLVGLLLTVVFAKSAGQVLSQSWREYQQS